MKPTNFSQKSAGATKEMTTAVVPARPQAVESATSAGQRSAAAASTQQPGGEGALLPGPEGSPEQLQRVGFWSGGVSRVGGSEPGTGLVEAQGRWWVYRLLCLAPCGQLLWRGAVR